MFPLLTLNKSIPDEKLPIKFSFGIIHLSFMLLFFVFPEILNNCYCNFRIQFSAIVKTIMTFSGGLEIQHWLEMGQRVEDCAFSC